jgi:hypothetical protein
VAESDRDRLRRLTERLDVAAQRAERLLSESVLAAATAQPPADGSREGDPAASDPAASDAAPSGPAASEPAPSSPAASDAAPSDLDAVGAGSSGADEHPRRPPPSGWQRPRVDDPGDRDRWLESAELELLLTVLAGVRDRIPAELRQRLAAAVRELLMALRALIDWYLERSDRPARASADVEDIPIL